MRAQFRRVLGIAQLEGPWSSNIEVCYVKTIKFSLILFVAHDASKNLLSLANAEGGMMTEAKGRKSAIAT